MESLEPAVAARSPLMEEDDAQTLRTILFEELVLTMERAKRHVALGGCPRYVIEQDRTALGCYHSLTAISYYSCPCHVIGWSSTVDERGVRHRVLCRVGADE